MELPTLISLPPRQDTSEKNSSTLMWTCSLLCIWKGNINNVETALRKLEGGAGRSGADRSRRFATILLQVHVLTIRHDQAVPVTARITSHHLRVLHDACSGLWVIFTSGTLASQVLWERIEVADKLYHGGSSRQWPYEHMSCRYMYDRLQERIAYSACAISCAGKHVGVGLSSAQHTRHLLELHILRGFVDSIAPRNALNSCRYRG